MMTDDLSTLIKNSPTEEPVLFSDDELDIVIEEGESEQRVSIPTSISLTNLADWIKANISNFPNIRQPSVTLAGVNPDEQLLITVGVERREDGSEKRKVIIFDNANTTSVLDAPAIDMKIYNNGFRIVHNLQHDLFIKSYGLRVGLVAVFCNDIDDLLIPYSIVRAKKKNTTIDVSLNDPSIVRSKLTETLDFEALQLRYSQSSKAEGLRTNLDAIKWLTDRQSTIEDVNHHIQIDNVIIDMLS